VNTSTCILGRPPDLSEFLPYTPQLSGDLAESFNRFARDVAALYKDAPLAACMMGVTPGDVDTRREALFRTQHDYVTKVMKGPKQECRTYYASLMLLRDLLRINGAFCSFEGSRLTVAVPTSRETVTRELRCAKAVSLAAHDRVLKRVKKRRDFIDRMEGEPETNDGMTRPVSRLKTYPEDLVRHLSQQQELRGFILSLSSYLRQTIYPRLQPVCTTMACADGNNLSIAPKGNCPHTHHKLTDIYDYFRMHYAHAEEVTPDFSMKYLVQDMAQGASIMGLVELASPRPQVVNGVGGDPERVRNCLLQVAFCEAVPPYDCIGGRKLIAGLLNSPSLARDAYTVRRVLCTDVPDAPFADWLEDGGGVAALVHDAPTLEVDCGVRSVTGDFLFAPRRKKMLVGGRSIPLVESRTRYCCACLSAETLKALSLVSGIELTPCAYLYSRDREELWSLVRGALEVMLTRSAVPEGLHDVLFTPINFARSYLPVGFGTSDYLAGGKRAYLSIPSASDEVVASRALAVSLGRIAWGKWGDVEPPDPPPLDLQAMERSVEAFNLPQD